MVWASNSGGGRDITTPVETGPETLLAFYTMGTRSFPVVEVARVWH
jgi:hypothetical protein